MPGLDASHAGIVAEVVSGWEHLDEADRERLLDDTDALMRTKQWEAARGFELTEAMRVRIAAQAALLILGLDFETYRRVHSIIVHPRTIVRSGVRAGPVRGVVTEGELALLGQAAHGYGPIMMAWDAVLRDSRRRRLGRNVVFHEFAHKIDMLDDLIDGTPPIPDPVQRQQWIDVCTEVFERVRGGTHTGPLRSYAAVNPGEFFAVATEVFFTTPAELLGAVPDLYGVLRSFYRQDPAARAEARGEQV